MCCVEEKLRTLVKNVYSRDVAGIQPVVLFHDFAKGDTLSGSDTTIFFGRLDLLQGTNPDSRLDIFPLVGTPLNITADLRKSVFEELLFKKLVWSTLSPYPSQSVDPKLYSLNQANQQVFVSTMDPVNPQFAPLFRPVYRANEKFEDGSPVESITDNENQVYTVNYQDGTTYSLNTLVDLNAYNYAGIDGNEAKFAHKGFGYDTAPHTLWVRFIVADGPFGEYQSMGSISVASMTTVAQVASQVGPQIGWPFMTAALFAAAFDFRYRTTFPGVHTSYRSADYTGSLGNEVLINPVEYSFDQRIQVYFVGHKITLS